MAAAEKIRIQRALITLRKQRVILKERLESIDENFCRFPEGSQERLELQKARTAIIEALRLNTVAIRNLRIIPRSC
jgi:hypothetical protein